jgi:hypothetical protein
VLRSLLGQHCHITCKTQSGKMRGSELLCIYMLLKGFRRDSHMLDRYHPRTSHFVDTTRARWINVRFVNLGIGKFSLPLRRGNASSLCR